MQPDDPRERPHPGPLRPQTPRIPGFAVLALRGTGSTGAVYAARREADGRHLAVKVVGTPGDRAAARREIDVLSRVRAPGLVRLHDVVACDDGRLALIVDLVDGGVLRDVVEARGLLYPREVVGVLRSVCGALAVLHARGIVHGDLSAGNVLLTREGRAVLGDLGSARLVGERCREVRGTRGFLAPEVELSGAVSTASDVYGVGVLGWLMLSGRLPGDAYARQSAERALPDCPAALRDLITSCLAGDPAARPSATEALARCDGLGAEEPLALPSGPDLGDRLTSRLRWERPEPDEGAPDDSLEALGLPPLLASGAGGGAAGVGPVGVGVAGVPARRGLPGRALAGRHRGREPARLARVAARVGRLATGAGARLVLAAVLGVACGLGVWAGVSLWRGDDLPLLGRVVAPWVAGSPGPGASPTTTAGGAASVRGDDDSLTRAGPGTGEGGGLGGPPAADGDPRAAARALPGLLAERALAYATARPEHLDRCYAPNAAGLTAARADVEALRRAGVRYEGLTYTVREARLIAATTRSAVPEARVAARVETGAYRRVAAAAPLQGGSPVPRDDTVPGPTPTTQALVYTLRWTAAGWRLAAVES